MTNDNLVATDFVETTGPPAALKLRTDIDHLPANSEDISLAEVSVVDAQGRVVPTASDSVTFSITGSGTIAGVGNGDPASHEPDIGTQRRAFNGHCVALVKAGNIPGKLALTATAPGLATAILEIPVEKK